MLKAQKIDMKFTGFTVRNVFSCMYIRENYFYISLHIFLTQCDINKSNICP